MKFEIISEKENPLVKRKEYWVMVDHSGKETPSRHDLLPEISKKLGAKSDLTVLCKVFSERGVPKSKAKVFVYADKKDIPKSQLERHERKVKSFLEKKAAAQPAAEEKPAEEAASEQPAAGNAEETPAGQEAKEAPAEEKAEEAEAPAEEAPAEEKKDE